MSTTDLAAACIVCYRRIALSSLLLLLLLAASFLPAFLMGRKYMLICIGRAQIGADGPVTRFLAVSTVCFDVATVELFMALLAGGTVVIATRAQASDPAELAPLLASSALTHMQATPTTYRMLLRAGWPGDPLLVAVSVGEALPQELADTLTPRVAALWNAYGPTEATVYVALWRAVPGEPVQIGTSIRNCSVRAGQLQLPQTHPHFFSLCARHDTGAMPMQLTSERAYRLTALACVRAMSRANTYEA